MAKQTLLDITKRVLTSIDSDEVDSITDTVEAEKVVSIIQDVYESIVDDRDWQFKNTVFKLFGLDDDANPTKMQIPDDITLYVNEIKSIRYNIKKISDTLEQFVTIPYVTPSEFLELSARLDNTLSTVARVSGQNDVDIYIETDKAPSMWTTWGDGYVYFNSFDAGIDSTLKTDKTICEGIKDFTFIKTDNWTPEIPSEMFTLLISAAKSKAWIDIRQTPNPAENQVYRTAKLKANRKEGYIKRNIIGNVDYGRK